MQHDTFFTLHA